MAERQFGPYRLVRQIAVGGMAEIHLAKTKGIAGFEKYVAVKMIHPNFAEDDQFIQMLVDEAKIAVQLNHSNIAQTFDLGRVGTTYYITMEYVDGADLYKILHLNSERDVELPLDVCAFVVKHVALALDHAHRKRDHNGKPLGIVHRDVSPQNVLISYSGEVKLVDFGIAKATMKVRQTAVGVIKGKYYYMSPEQARGEPLDCRSDLFSAGIVLYEMITGQMLYLEEDLQKLLDMARKANIAPPSTLRKGIPPQLERIVMHALEKDRQHRYQSGQELATDLERFLHTYSPVFTASKVSQVLRQVIGDPTEVPNEDVEVRDGAMATHQLRSEDLVLDKGELSDENSVLFHVAEAMAKQGERAGTPEGRITRQAEIEDAPSGPLPPSKPTAPAAESRQPRAPSRPRSPHEHTLQVATPAVSDPPRTAAFTLATPLPSAIASWRGQDSDTTLPQGADLETTLPRGPDLEATMVTGAPSSFDGIMTDGSSEGDATLVSPEPPVDDEFGDEGETLLRPVDADLDGATRPRDVRVVGGRRTSLPPALAAKIHAPAVSELRKPRTSRKTPQSGIRSMSPNLLQALVGAKPAEPMPAPRSQPALDGDSSPPAEDSRLRTPLDPTALAHHIPVESRRDPDTGTTTIAQPPVSTPSEPPPLASPGQPPQGTQGYPPAQPQEPPPPAGGGYVASPVAPPAAQPFGQPLPPGYPAPPQDSQYPGFPQSAYSGYQAPPMTSQPFGAAPQRMSLTGQMRLSENDEIPTQYKVSGAGAQWLKLLIAGVTAIVVAGGVTYFFIKTTRDAALDVATIRIESVPPGADVTFDQTRLAGTTPITIDSVPLGTRHEITVELARHKTYTDTVDTPKRAGDVLVKAFLTPITGKLTVITDPDGAEIWIGGQLRGRAPMTVTDIDMSSAKQMELRLEGYKTYSQPLQWPDNGRININQKLQR